MLLTLIVNKNGPDVEYASLSNSMEEANVIMPVLGWILKYLTPSDPKNEDYS